MAATTHSQAEQEEVAAVLKSGIFHRAPNLDSFFRYICDRHFKGEAGEVKEYSIAIEALRRPPDFDQKKDSIVRVEAHRLRKRLSEFYATDGASHVVKITIPPGQYVPRFTFQDTPGSQEEPVADPASGQLAPLPTISRTGMIADRTVQGSLRRAQSGVLVEVPRRKPKLTWLAWITVGLLCLAAGAGVLWSYNHKRSAPSEVWQGPLNPLEGEVRFLAGYHGNPFHDRQGRVWQSDRYYNGGLSLAVPAGRAYEALPDPAFVHSFREGTFRYDIPLVPGTYELRLYFVETVYGEGNPGGGPVNVRLFRVDMNGKPILDLFDALSEAGAPNRLQERVFRDVSPAEDGKLHLSFQQVGYEKPFLSALELLPTTAGHLRPIRIVAQKSNVADAKGRVWQADEYAVGGTQVDGRFATGPEHVLFSGERYGNFTYRIPVAPGKYRLRLFFAETYFGTELPYAQNNRAEPRVFNVFANGVVLVRDFNLAKEAGGPNRPVVKEFEDLEPNAQGLIVLEFIPVHNYAEVNAIEVLQME
jgi:hypothetical protein